MLDVDNSRQGVNFVRQFSRVKCRTGIGPGKNNHFHELKMSFGTLPVS